MTSRRVRRALAKATITAAVLGVFATGSWWNRAEASSITCGQTLGPGGTFRLDASLTDCAGTALVVKSAELDLNGHSVQCASESGTGVRIEGSGSRVTNGFVSGCGFGVDVSGSGGHRVERVTAVSHAIGFVVTAGSDNDLVLNTATDCDFGFVVQVGNNRLSGNTAKANVVSFIINAGTDNDVSDNTAKDSAFGIQVSAPSTRLSGNTVAGNRAGVFVSAGGNELVENVVTDNRSGITVQGGSEGNRLRSNAVSSNAVVDVTDENPCGRNEWLGNTFGLASEACIR